MLEIFIQFFPLDLYVLVALFLQYIIIFVKLIEPDMLLTITLFQMILRQLRIIIFIKYHCSYSFKQSLLLLLLVII